MKQAKKGAEKPVKGHSKGPDKSAAKGQEIGVVQLTGCRCRCGHEWLPREKDERPRVCPKCKSANWDRPKKFERK